LQIAIGRLGDQAGCKIFQCVSCNGIDWVAA
jgi:hypothetical protein